MGDERRDEGVESGGDALAGVDVDLNIFALANGMDLYRDHTDPPDRVLEWFRDGLERRIHLRPSPAGTLDMEVAALGKIDGERRVRRAPFRSSVATGELRGLLIDAIDAANALRRDELT